jgi:hypothetical protein
MRQVVSEVATISAVPEYSEPSRLVPWTLYLPGRFWAVAVATLASRKRALAAPKVASMEFSPTWRGARVRRQSAPKYLAQQALASGTEGATLPGTAQKKSPGAGSAEARTHYTERTTYPDPIQPGNGQHALLLWQFCDETLSVFLRATGICRAILRVYGAIGISIVGHSEPAGAGPEALQKLNLCRGAGDLQ